MWEKQKQTSKQTKKPSWFHLGKQRQELYARIEAETVEKCCFLACFSGTAYSELSTSILICNEENAPQVSVIEAVLYVRLPHSKCVKLTTQICHHSYIDLNLNKTKQNKTNFLCFPIEILYICWDRLLLMVSSVCLSVSVSVSFSLSCPPPRVCVCVCVRARVCECICMSVLSIGFSWGSNPKTQKKKNKNKNSINKARYLNTVITTICRSEQQLHKR
jgi:hypothetical protein